MRREGTGERWEPGGGEGRGKGRRTGEDREKGGVDEVWILGEEEDGAWGGRGARGWSMEGGKRRGALWRWGPRRGGGRGGEEREEEEGEEEEEKEEDKRIKKEGGEREGRGGGRGKRWDENEEGGRVLYIFLP